MSSIEIAELTGKQHAHVMRDIRNLLDQGIQESNFGLSSYKQEIPNGGYKNVDYYELTRKGSLILASGYNALLREKIIDRWEELETGKARPIAEPQPKPKREPSPMQKMKIGVEWVRNVSEILNLSDSSKLTLLGKIADPLELPMPDYVPSKGTLKSATELLIESKTQISAREFNTMAMQKGILCELERKSSGGQKKKFKSITKAGLAFGENQVNPNNPKSTQPCWYADKFYELLIFLGFTKKDDTITNVSELN